MQRLFLACTPRTGNVWFRKMLATSLQWTETAAHRPWEVPWLSLPRDCIVAMHWRFSHDFRQMLRSHGFVPIVTVRHPLDVLISMLRFSQRERATSNWLDGQYGDEHLLHNADPNSPEFLEYALSERASALLSISAEWLPHAASIVRYEDLVAQPELVLGRIIQKIGRSPILPLAEVIESHTMERMRAICRHHFWLGQPGLWRRLLTPALRRAISHRHRPIFEQLGYDCDCSTVPNPETTREQWRALCRIESLPMAEVAAG